MLALYRSGRQADALRAFQATREVARRGARHRPLPSTAPPGGADPAPGPGPRSIAAGGLADDLRQPGREPLHGPPRVPRVRCRPVLRPGRPRRHPRPTDRGRRRVHRRRRAQRIGQVERRARRADPAAAARSARPAPRDDAARNPALRRAGGGPHRRGGRENDARRSRSSARRRPASSTRSLALLDDGDQLLLVVDQFEEVFTLVEPEEAAAFLAALQHAAEAPERPGPRARHDAGRLLRPTAGRSPAGRAVRGQRRERGPPRPRRAGGRRHPARPPGRRGASSPASSAG